MGKSISLNIVNRERSFVPFPSSINLTFELHFKANMVHCSEYNNRMPPPAQRDGTL